MTLLKHVLWLAPMKNIMLRPPVKPFFILDEISIVLSPFKFHFINGLFKTMH